jgi:DNA repair protein RadC
MIAERREISKTFRTTPSIAESIKMAVNSNISESDIINLALGEYLTNFKEKSKTSKDIADFKYATYEYHRKKTLELLNSINKNSETISTPKQVAEYFKTLMPPDKENVFVLYLSPRNHILKVQIAGEGSQKTVSMDTTTVIKNALELDPCHVIHIHNHPGGVAEPSPMDILTTRNAYFTYACSGIMFSDEIILDDKNNYYSFVDHGYFKLFKKELNKQYIDAKKKWYK